MGNRRAAPVGEKRVGRTIGAVLGWAMRSRRAQPRTSASTQNDPRVGLSTGQQNAGVAAGAWGCRPPAQAARIRRPGNPGSFAFANSDLAFQGDHAFVGNFNGFNIYNISDPAAPSLRTSVVCPGGQGDLSVYGNLLFMSVEETRAEIDCTLTGVPTRPRASAASASSTSATSIALAGGECPDLSRVAHPHARHGRGRSRQCLHLRSGNGGRPPAGRACRLRRQPTRGTPTGDNPSKWRIEVIKVPLATPQDAAIVNEPRLFAEPDTGAINGLQNAPQTTQHPSGMAGDRRPVTDACHDITVYPEMEIAAGACEGNGLLIDISDPANPKRIDAVADPLYAYWHGATF